jgi:hypothetical protein
MSSDKLPRLEAGFEYAHSASLTRDLAATIATQVQIIGGSPVERPEAKARPRQRRRPRDDDELTR